MSIYRKHTKIGSLLLLLWILVYISFTLWVWTLLPKNFWIDIFFFPIAGFLWLPIAIKLIKYSNRDNI